MSALDWIIVVLYFIGLILLSSYLGKGQTSTEDYYLGSRKMSWWSLSISTMATQLGIISFISAPAFIALKPEGGLVWLGYEFGVPLAMIFIMIFILPVLHQAKVISIYDYLERRFDLGTRALVSLMFQIGRSLATGVSIYTAALLLEVLLKIPIWVTILLIGLITIIYDTLGGMKAVVYSDVIQMIIIILGIFACGTVAYTLIGGLEGLRVVEPWRFKAIDLSGHGLGDGKDFGFLPLVIGGFFLYASYYGCDQSQVQREISAKSIDDGKRSLMLNGFVRFLLVLAYCVMGLFVGAFAKTNGEFLSIIPPDKIDQMVPLFILHYIPIGLTGIIVAAMLAAVMSNLDSSINSMSATTMLDIYQPYFTKDKGKDGKKEHLFVSKTFTVAWGIICTGFAFLVGGISETVIEAINKVSSLFYGPILAAFILAIMTKRAKPLGVKIGVTSGIAVNLILWIWFPKVSWLWWNTTGCITALITGYMLSLISPWSTGREGIKYEDSEMSAGTVNWRVRYVFLSLYFLGIIVFSYIIQDLVNYL